VHSCKKEKGRRLANQATAQAVSGSGLPLAARAVAAAEVLLVVNRCHAAIGRIVAGPGVEVGHGGGNDETGVREPLQSSRYFTNAEIAVPMEGLEAPRA